jgi:hypothetical protein
MFFLYFFGKPDELIHTTSGVADGFGINSSGLRRVKE